jgi:integrase/recombinase XerD
MLEKYFVRQETIDGIRASWVGVPVEKYVEWLSGNGYAARNVFRRVPRLIQFGEFARLQGATKWDELPRHIEGFATFWLEKHGQGCKNIEARKRVLREATNPLNQMLRLILTGSAGVGPPNNAIPFCRSVPGFFDHLRNERGLSEATIYRYRHSLHRFEGDLQKVGLQDLSDLSPLVLTAFVTDRSPRMVKTSLRDLCGTLRVFLRYLHRERIVPKDLSDSGESPRIYRLSTLPRSITWEEVRHLLDVVDHRTSIGERDYAILVLLVTYGLRGHEVAALTLDDIDWRAERLRIPERKAGHSTAYPLSSTVGAAILDYLKHGRPKTSDRHVFFRTMAPFGPITSGAVSSRASHYLKKAGIKVARPGSHTLRHTCVQRLVDAEFSLKIIGDYVGHRVPSSTEIHAKVAVDALREVASGDGEAIV